MPHNDTLSISEGMEFCWSLFASLDIGKMNMEFVENDDKRVILSRYSFIHICQYIFFYETVVWVCYHVHTSTWDNEKPNVFIAFGPILYISKPTCILLLYNIFHDYSREYWNISNNLEMLYYNSYLNMYENHFNSNNPEVPFVETSQNALQG